MQDIINDIEQLQMKVAFQEDTIESLNKALIAQQFAFKQLSNKVLAIEPTNMAAEHEESPPPHY